MTQLVRKIAVWLIFYYLLIFIPSFAIEESRYLFGPANVYIHRDVHKSIYKVGPQYAAYGVNKLNNYSDQIFIIGPSACARAFNPETLMKEISGYEVSNLCVDGSDITEQRQILDLIESRVDLRTLHSAIFVLSVQFGSFVDQRLYTGDVTTSIDKEKLRFHLYQVRNERVVPVLPEPYMTAAFILVRPFIWLYKLEVDMSDALKEAAEEISAVFSKQESKEQSRNPFWNKTFWLKIFEHGGLKDDQFHEFEGVIDRLSAAKATIVIVDLPVPGYVRNEATIFGDYRKRMKKITRIPAVHYLDLTAWAPDDQFVDSAHPKPELYDRWAGELARHLKTVIRHPAVKQQ